MSQFCRDCKNMFVRFGTERCSLTAEEYVNHVTGEVRWLTSACHNARTGYSTCRNFEQKPTLIQRLKEVFS